MNPHRRRFLGLGMLGGAAVFGGWRLAATATDFAVEPDPEPFRREIGRLRDLFEKKRPPGPNDWLAQHDEEGQTFEQYLSSRPNRPTAARTRLYLQPIGDLTADEARAQAKLVEFMGLVFGLEVKVLEKIGLERIPAAARRINPGTRKPQILSTHVLDAVLKPRRPQDAVAVLALTPVDLWPGEGWNFVFGQASLGDRVGVWSTARMGDPVKEPGVYLRRVLQVAVHETGHMFGIHHCTAYECCMNGSNHLAESDRTPLVFCPECDAKLGWACRLDMTKRADALAKFAAANQLAADSAQWTKVAARLRNGTK